MLNEKPASIRDCHGNVIPGIFSHSDNSKRAVLISHGLMGDKNEYLMTSARIARELAIRECSSLRIDYFGHGDSSLGMAEFMFASQVGNLCAAIKWLLAQGYCRIVGLGISFGAPPILQVAEMYPEAISSCVLIAPVLDFQMTFVDPVTTWGREFFGRARIIESARTEGLALSDDYVLHAPVLLDILNMDVLKLAARVEQPIKIFHGDSDDMVPLSSSEACARANEGVSLCIMPMTEHGITKVGDEAFQDPTTLGNLDRIVTYIAKDGFRE